MRGGPGNQFGPGGMSPNGGPGGPGGPGMMRPQPNIGPGGPGMRDRRPDMGPGERPGPYRDGGYGRPPRRDDHDDSGAAAAVMVVEVSVSVPIAADRPLVP